MDWQLLVAWIAIAIAAGFVFLRIWRTWRGTKGGCGGSCGCSKSTADAKPQPALIKPEQLVLRQAKEPRTQGGLRPQPNGDG
jgi:FeoB-associated Cys-rich membrane protein